MNRDARWWIWSLILALAACRSGDGAGEPPGNVGLPVDPSESSVSVSQYCEQFARTHSQINGLDYKAERTSTEMSSDVRMWLQNAVQPVDSRFTAGYVCRFQATEGEDVRKFAVRIYLTKTRSFAEHTQWEDLQSVPIRHVLDETNDREGFGVFKYLRGR